MSDPSLSAPAPTVHVLIVAAGRGARFGGPLPKQYCSLAGQPVLRRTLTAFLAHPAVAGVRVVIHPDDRALYDAATDGLDLAEPVAGGATRQESVRNGLEAIAPAAPDLVLIHDAARPLISAGTVDRLIASLATHVAAIAAVPVRDTVKRAEGSRIADTVDRTHLWRAQTPQAFRFADILAAHRAAVGLDLTDDAAVAERAGHPVELVMGDEDNFKITTADDLARAEAAMMARLGDVRVGQGFDVHQLVPGDHCWINGIRIAHDQTLLGHSDADVGLHALTDAILGAISAGDIGQHFPPTDERWRGAASDKFLAHAGSLVKAKGGMIAHCDVTIICERPKIGPHRAAMAERIAEILGLSLDRVSVKATTTEKLGFTGRGEGIAAQATATVRLPFDLPAPGIA
ncbi:bifunctional 2-C-methyl-D-erythritol 4-phosphate cytidylyltransferase/2-C-methyl-D-erythritol 2,4-cyclodiphosphate synthase [Aliidongia dinghuensis]|nr:bifunctional 2-C-methyl-D-erythritol 4-phosphate cytidylyltransferase/2-C-methyl-D-erythritol 2,4-cyclodiphosphate synthase [Aliidongia dinghuensis]